MTSNSNAWQELGDAWRGGDWTACVTLLRPIVDELPEVLSTRLLLAGFATLAKNPGLAMLHYEKLMVLAVGQGELYHAIAAERGLDGIRHEVAGHRKRVQALQQWFKTMPARSRKKKHVAVPHAWMVDLPAADFRHHAEAGRLMVLSPEPQVFEDAADVFAIVLHGSASWTYAPAGEAALPAVTAGSDEVITPPSGCHEGDRLTIEAREPGVLLCFTGPVATSLRERAAAERRAAIPPKLAAVPRFRKESQEAARESAARAAESAPRPLPDPVVEPMTSRQAPAPDRRREHELRVRFADGGAELGIAGSRTGAIAGRLAELSPAGLTITVPRPTVRQSRATLEGAHIVTLVTLPGDEEPLRLAARVTGLSFDPGSLAATPRAQLAIEFVLLLAHDRARLQEALIEATRSGQWPWAADSAAPPEASRRAA